MPATEISIVIGEVVFSAAELSGVRWNSQLRGIATAEFTMDCNAEKTHRVCMTDPVEVRSGDYRGASLRSDARSSELTWLC